jgi:hypothetical protein
VVSAYQAKKAMNLYLSLSARLKVALKNGAGGIPQGVILVTMRSQWLQSRKGRTCRAYFFIAYDPQIAAGLRRYHPQFGGRIPDRRRARQLNYRRAPR